MPAPVIYSPPAFARYFGFTADPNSAAGGSNMETIAADATNFVGGVIPDVTNARPVTTATHDFAPTRISRANEVSSIRAAKPDVPFKVSPMYSYTIDAYRLDVERALKYVMGSEVTTGAGPFVHTVSALALGSTQLPSALIQMIRDGVNLKSSGAVLESVDLTFPFDGAGTLQIEAHPLYSALVTTAMPTGTVAEPNALPLVIRDAQAVFDGGASSAISVSAFRFGYKNNGSYDRQVAGHCIDTKSVGLVPINRQLWYPYYHRVAARQTVTWGLDFLDTQQAQEVAALWGQLQKIVVTIGEPNVAGNQIVFNLFATEIESGGVDALTATGDQTTSFNGSAFYSSTDATDVSVAITNTTTGAIA